jgi:hypothetical protein
VVAALDRRVWVDPETQLKLIEGPIPASRR